MLKIGIFGANGRVGERLVNILRKSANLKLSVVFARKDLDFPIDSGMLVTNNIKTFLKESDAIIDFTSPKGTELLLESAISYKQVPIVIGTTGLDSHQKNLIVEASKQMPILYATNMSLGVALLNQLVYTASKALKDFDIEILEMHHRKKKDSPSGTALTLGEYASRGRDTNLDEVRVSGRDGVIGERTDSEIGVMALRGGDIVGRHTVGFYSDGEFLELNHTATNRDTFAKGAITACEWLVKQPSGLYDIKDCLDL